jgi:DNA-binding MarR family transcriptional regulator
MPDSVPSDSVDALLASWAQSRPDLDFSPVSVISRLGRLRSHIDAELDRVFAAHGLGAASFGVLVTLARIGGERGVSQRRLMEELGLTSGTISVRMDRLVDQGLVDRRPDPASRRTTLITLTERGRSLFERVAPEHLSNERRLLAALSGDEQAAAAGLRTGDVLLAAGDRELRSIAALHAAAGERPLRLRVLRGGEERDVEITPAGALGRAASAGPAPRGEHAL